MTAATPHHPLTPHHRHPDPITRITRVTPRHPLTRITRITRITPRHPLTRITRTALSPHTPAVLSDLV